jgi:hypothetical protein
MTAHYSYCTLHSANNSSKHRYINRTVVTALTLLCHCLYGVTILFLQLLPLLQQGKLLE